ncbi:hypothetical protein JDV02_005784 [Purpureocillium takamizusanense]|uniref:Uncharacterized protein n=1 Tax=Purpureocillium takamizusanense TaxID=2060973 RepID=A0A9Q8QHA3_9HYPO|nr:uncharacterized protein JDV02_005784 [Purpureocillium takamizusanense]UNI19605.1 hypothetical protein JDV02_005784 [Purpureocillium takamizusanense]
MEHAHGYLNASGTHATRFASPSHATGGQATTALAAAPLSGPPSRRLASGATRVGYWAATGQDGVARANAPVTPGTARDNQVLRRNPRGARLSPIHNPPPHTTPPSTIEQGTTISDPGAWEPSVTG